jgi:hypothetical protein
MESGDSFSMSSVAAGNFFGACIEFDSTANIRTVKTQIAISTTPQILYTAPSGGALIVSNGNAGGPEGAYVQNLTANAVVIQSYIVPSGSSPSTSNIPDGPYSVTAGTAGPVASLFPEGVFALNAGDSIQISAAASASGVLGVVFNVIENLNL